MRTNSSTTNLQFAMSNNNQELQSKVNQLSLMERGLELLLQGKHLIEKGKEALTPDPTLVTETLSQLFEGQFLTLKVRKDN